MLMTGLAFFLSAASIPGETTVASAPEAKLSLGYEVKDRQVVAQSDDHAYLAGETVIAWTKVVGISTGFVEHVWTCGDKEVARHYLPVSNGRSWRTWSRHKVQAGDYKVQVLGPGSKELATSTFKVTKGD